MTQRVSQNAIPGGALGASTDPSKSNASGLARDRIDIFKSDKFRSGSQNFAYALGGALSAALDEGKFAFNRFTNEVLTSSFLIDNQLSRLVSTLRTSVLGSPKIETRDGYVLNPGLKDLPSSFFTPIRGWLPNLFPKWVFDKWYIKLPILVALDRLISEVVHNKQYIEYSDTENKDLATILVDNQDLEKKILTDYYL